MDYSNIFWAMLINKWEFKSVNKVICTGKGMSINDVYRFIYTVKHVMQSARNICIGVEEAQ